MCYYSYCWPCGTGDCGSLPPQAPIQLLYHTVECLAAHPTDHILFFGHFNRVPVSGLHKIVPDGISHSDPMSWAQASLLTNACRWWNPSKRIFTCHSATYKTCSCIDIVFSGSYVLPRVWKIAELRKFPIFWLSYQRVEILYRQNMSEPLLLLTGMLLKLLQGNISKPLWGGQEELRAELSQAEHRVYFRTRLYRNSGPL